MSFANSVLNSAMQTLDHWQELSGLASDYDGDDDGSTSESPSF